MANAQRSWSRLIKCSVAAYMPEWAVRSLPYRVQTHNQANWNEAYADGSWAYLDRSGELARYGTIASYCHHFSSGGAYLDLGCGEGILHQHFNVDRYSGYLGVDLSAKAVARAQQLWGSPKSQFEVGNVETYAPQGRYDAIVFNEVLYYCADPVQVVAQYESCLDKTGVIVVSMFDMLKARKIWQQLNARYRLIEASRAVNHDGHSWSIRVYRPAVG